MDAYCRAVAFYPDVTLARDEETIMLTSPVRDAAGLSEMWLAIVANERMVVASRDQRAAALAELGL
ncbi:MAG: hypothetical protein ACOY45_04595 [Pseudomonadota bacterium]